MANNFEQFLTLLTTQLKNQNPLEPLDTNQFTQQLVQFAQVEQQINMNQQMATLISVQKATQTSAALGFGFAHHHQRIGQAGYFVYRMGDVEHGDVQVVTQFF